MNRLSLLCCAFTLFTACDVGNVPDEGAVDCAKLQTPGDGHHNTGMSCNMGGCHGENNVPPLPIAGTVYETSAGAPKGGATVIIQWQGGEAKFITGGPGADQAGNFFDYAEPPGIVYPATVKVSLCPDPDKAMVGTLASAADLDCSKSGCHTANLKIFLK